MLERGEKIKLQKYLQLCGYARRKADIIIFSGRIKVNNKVVKEPWYEVKNSDVVSLDNQKLTSNNFEYYALHKPKGYVTTLYDPKEKKTIKEFFKDKPLKVAGRLDKDATGVLILTNDGELINILTSAKYRVKKVYIVKVKGKINFKELLTLKKGIWDNGEFLRLEYFEILDVGFNYSTVKVEMIKGKKHEVKRLFKNINHEVLELKRISHGPIDISFVPNPGDIKEIKGKLLKKLLKLKERKA
ncbi:pseudouridine synthase [Thermosipho affectus]|uniref:Pseudouridine synthase n=1 Tax=Thermosipho affectus TaxID=660294 RepID=A0ABX3IIA4_9BACT|nr:pseudouridine synthase [Thermosipho affectus]